MTTDSYFWNGSFANGSYTSLALAAQTRTNCELILFGFIEGPSSDPARRVGDPNNRVTNGDDLRCRPQAVQANGLPANFDQITPVIAAQKQVAAQRIQQVTGLTRDQVFRFVDFYSVSEQRLPPNPLTYLKQANQLDGATAAKIDEGAQLFTSAGCANCHDPNNTRHPFSDGLNHGAGASWTQRFVDVYASDQRIVNAIDGIPQAMLEALQDVAAGRVVIPPQLNHLLAAALRGESRPQSAGAAGLTEQELRILEKIAAGLSNKQIGRELDIAEGTVKVHVKHILRKLELRSRVEAAVWAVEHLRM